MLGDLGDMMQAFLNQPLRPKPELDVNIVHYTDLGGGITVEHHLHQMTLSRSGLTMTCSHVYGDGVPCQLGTVAVGFQLDSWAFRAYGRSDMPKEAPDAAEEGQEPKGDLG